MIRLIVILSFFFTQWLTAQIDVIRFASYCDSAMIQGVELSRIPGAVMGIVSADSLLLLKGYGLSDVERGVPVDPTNSLFQLGSIGKLMTSIAILQQVEAHKISLDEDVNTYLDDLQLQNPFTQKITVAHLLTHTSGLNDQFIGYLARSNEEIKPLGGHLKENMPGLFQPPGTNINYSNYGYALAGYLVERVSGKRFTEYVQESIFDPIGMTTATYNLPDRYLDEERYAKGYLTRDAFVLTRMYPRHAIPAGSLIATGHDMVLFAQALMRRDTALLSRKGYDFLFAQQFSNHPKLTGYTMGMEVQDFNGEFAVAKGGQVNGFLSVLILFNNLDLGLFISTNTETDNHFEEFFNGMKDRFFPPGISDAPSVSFDAKDFSGTYANERRNHKSIEELFAMHQGQLTIWEGESGNLSFLERGEWCEYRHIGEDIFVDISNKYRRIAFQRDSNGKVSHLYRSVRVGGIDVPASYHKLYWLERPSLISYKYPIALIGILTYLIIPLLWFFESIFRTGKPNFGITGEVNFYYHLAAFLYLFFFMWSLFGFFVPLIGLKEQIAFGLPESLLAMKYVHWIVAAYSFVLLFLAFHLLANRKGRLWFRVYYFLFSLFSLSFVWILYRWHFLNVTV